MRDDRVKVHVHICQWLIQDGMIRANASLCVCVCETSEVCKTSTCSAANFPTFQF